MTLLGGSVVAGVSPFVEDSVLASDCAAFVCVAPGVECFAVHAPADECCEIFRVNESACYMIIQVNEHMVSVIINSHSSSNKE